MAEDARSRRVLLVDDEEDLRALLTSIVSDLGYEVEAAADGWSALLSIEEDPPALVFLDLLLPRMDGLTLLTHLRESGSRMPIVLLTACGDEKLIRKAIRAGASAYIAKPFRIRQLADTCARFLGRPKKERRRESRRNLSLDSLALSPEGAPPGHAWLVDLSPGGAQVGFGAALAPGDHVRVAFPVAGGELSLGGRVCWREHGAPGYAYGLAFEDLGTAEEQHILSLLSVRG
jgi:CheY-like chemotaxis protein